MNSKKESDMSEIIALLYNALDNYADPEFYFGIAYLYDPPCGPFKEDFTETHLGKKPGKLARETLDVVNKLLEKYNVQ